MFALLAFLAGETVHKHKYMYNLLADNDKIKRVTRVENGGHDVSVGVISEDILEEVWFEGKHKTRSSGQPFHSEGRWRMGVLLGLLFPTKDTILPGCCQSGPTWVACWRMLREMVHHHLVQEGSSWHLLCPMSMTTWLVYMPHRWRSWVIHLSLAQSFPLGHMWWTLWWSAT